MPISLDGTSIGTNYTNGGQTAGTWIHTVGSGAGLLVVTHGAVGAGTGVGTVTNINYGGFDLTRAVGTKVSTTRNSEIWYLVNPPSGVGTVKGSASTNTQNVEWNSISFTSDEPFIVPDAVFSGTTASGSVSRGTITTVNNNAWTVHTSSSGNTTPTGDANQTKVKATSEGAFGYWVGYGGPISPPGVVVYTGTGNLNTWSEAIMSFSPLFQNPGLIPQGMVNSIKPT